MQLIAENRLNYFFTLIVFFALAVSDRYGNLAQLGERVRQLRTTAAFHLAADAYVRFGPQISFSIARGVWASLTLADVKISRNNLLLC